MAKSYGFPNIVGILLHDARVKMPSANAPRSHQPLCCLGLHLHQVGRRTFTSKLLSMPSTQLTRWRGGRSRVRASGHKQR